MLGHMGIRPIIAKSTPINNTIRIQITNIDNSESDSCTQKSLYYNNAILTYF